MRGLRAKRRQELPPAARKITGQGRATLWRYLLPIPLPFPPPDPIPLPCWPA